jgi:hypothetical protein
MALIFLICLVAGVGWAVLVGVIGPLIGEIAGHAGEIHADHADAGHDHSASLESELIVTPLSPYVISAFLASFGGFGLIGSHALHLGVFGSLLLASPSSLIIAGAFFYTIRAISTVTQASSEARVRDLIGAEAEVSVPIPEGGTGEIVYYALGSRYNSPARTEDGSPIEHGVKVFITRIDGVIYFVKPLSEI